MPRVVPALDMDDVIRRYLAGESPRKIAPTVDVSPAYLGKRLAALGYRRSNVEARRLRASQGTGPAWVDEAVELHGQGLTQREIGERLGIVQATVSRALLDRGIRTDLSQAVRRRMQSMSTAERQANTAAANAAARGMKHTDGSLVARARTKMLRQSHATAEERRIAERLTAAGETPVLQEAVGKYNLDVGLAPVAVELFGGGWHAHGRHLARLPQRVVDLADAGRNLLVVWTHEAHPLDVTLVAEETLTYLESSRRDPAFRRQYRVVWGDGQFLAAGCVDDDQLTLVPTGIRGAYRRRTG